MSSKNSVTFSVSFNPETNKWVVYSFVTYAHPATHSVGSYRNWCGEFDSEALAYEAIIKLKRYMATQK